jgi:hypothetical protein
MADEEDIEDNILPFPTKGEKRIVKGGTVTIYSNGGIIASGFEFSQEVDIFEAAVLVHHWAIDKLDNC